MDTRNSYRVRTAKTREDLKRMYDVRYEGYRIYFDDKNKVIDECDFEPHCTLLIAEDANNNMVGTIRILDRRMGSIELDAHVPMEALFSGEELHCCEATRFSVPKHVDSKEIKWLLIKSVMCYCHLNGINYIIMSSRPEIARDYHTMRFRDIGNAGVYHHHDLGDTEHHSYILDIHSARDELKSCNPMLHDFFFVEESFIETDDLVLAVPVTLMV
ncbi:MAG: hypothetical protein SVY53_08760 [Chloroflexota bacterium]|nr:hypothetical protein [Chloroflexota bacterium]